MIERWLRIIRLPNGMEIVNLLSDRPEKTGEYSVEVCVRIDLERPEGERIYEKREQQ